MQTTAFAVLAFALAAPALAADLQQQSDQVHRYDKPDKPRVLCRREQVTGTHITTRVCRTAEEWATIGDDSDAAKIGPMTRGEAGGSGVVGAGTHGHD